MSGDAHDPVDPAPPDAGPDISEAAQVARQRLHEEIERVRVGVEEMLDSEADTGYAPEHQYGNGPDVRRELETLRLETRDYVKRKVGKAEKKLKRSIREIDARADKIERRIDQVEADRQAAEVRIHNSTERMLDGLLHEVRSIADRIAGPAAPPARPLPAVAKPAPEARPAPPSPPGPGGPAPTRSGPAQGPVGRIGRPLGAPRKRA